MRIGVVPWEYHFFESDLGSTWVQIENSRSYPKVYTTSLLNARTRSHDVGIRRTTVAHNREENSRK